MGNACAWGRSSIGGRSAMLASPPASSWCWIQRTLGHGWRLCGGSRGFMWLCRDLKWIRRGMLRAKTPLAWETSPQNGWSTTVNQRVECSGQRKGVSSQPYMACPNVGVTTGSTCQLAVTWKSTGRPIFPVSLTRWWRWLTGAVGWIYCGYAVPAYAASGGSNWAGFLLLSSTQGRESNLSAHRSELQSQQHFDMTCSLILCVFSSVGLNAHYVGLIWYLGQLWRSFCTSWSNFGVCMPFTHTVGA